jgi:hypothetical protein
MPAIKPTQPDAVPAFWIVSTVGSELTAVGKVIGPKEINEAEAISAPAAKSKVHAGNLELIISGLPLLQPL